MKKSLFIVVLLVLISACSKESDNTMYVKGNIKGLKKGTFYLQKQIDSIIVSVDSVEVIGTDVFVLSDEVVSPEMYYISLKNSDKKIAFFGEKDSINISSSLNKFGYNNKIAGSENQELLDKYFEVMKRFNDKSLDLIKTEFELKKSGNQDSIQWVEKQRNNLIKRKYLYGINYAINNSDYEVSPYIALTELNLSNVKWLDSIYNSLTPKIKDSKYGIQLENFIGNVKKAEN